MLDALLINFALLVSSNFALSLTYQHVHLRDGVLRILVRYVLNVAAAFVLMLHSAAVAPGLLFDFRSVVIALVSRRHGMVAGLLVAVPVALFRLYLGGPGAWAGVLNLILVALLSAWSSGLLHLRPRFDRRDLFHLWWQPLGLFAVANTATFLGFAMAGKPLLSAVPVYLTFTVLSAVGMMAGHAVKQTRLKALHRSEELQELAEHDPLTGCFNRRRFDDDTREVRPGQYVLLLDLDHFKHVNDTYGHDTGDRVLQVLVQVLTQSVRPTDRVYRMGGEEFAVVLSHCREDQAPAVAERVRSRVALHVAEQAGLTTERITVSGGLVPLYGERRLALRAADQRLYEAKHAGRNRIVADLRLAVPVA
ncbi:diguanylate cyclase [Deinococcus sonorensis]|uniref:Diguanylate cyclase n=2 Tax=Deinococcus sonorensis TaxID=309891 RepID=A0AAU7U421_9DEIO